MNKANAQHYLDSRARWTRDNNELIEMLGKDQLYAPAYYKVGSTATAFGLSLVMFPTREAAEEYLGDNFLGWPALSSKTIGFYPGPDPARAKEIRDKKIADHANSVELAKKALDGDEVEVSLPESKGFHGAWGHKI